MGKRPKFSPSSSDGRETICFHRPPVIGHPASGRRAAVWTDLCGCRSLKGAGLWAGEISCSFWQHGADLRPSMLSRRHGGRHSAVASRKPAQGHNKSNSRNRTKVFFIRPIRFFFLWENLNIFLCGHFLIYRYTYNFFYVSRRCSNDCCRCNIRKI